MTETVIQNGSLAACCESQENRVEVERTELDGGNIRIIERCAVCNRRHYTLSVAPIVIGLEGAPLA